ncbi:flagellar FlbD family protein [Microbacterium aurugineum]|uniref:flagellar FlbD family protein n=1 Tax=Microbacterium aurugineum TaxID=2851642 RepID=UPI0020C01611|nr:flagellar FlbD family protein [Microbacterium aurugineum]MCK8476613.1 flagellar FlbD family protein [Microbacterium aurugineum]
MIVLTRLNRSRFAVNPDLIERVQATPDTTLIMVDGATFVVTETMDDVIAQITRFRAGVLATAATLIAADEKNPAIAADAEAGL